jgi:uncharacterized protein (DUF58 family)
MRPGPRLVPALALLCAAALFVPLWTPLAWAVAALLIVLAAAAAVEALLLRRLRVEAEAAARLVLSVGETETVPLTVRTRGARAARLTVRQPWPALVEGGSTVRHGLARPGESLRLEMNVRATARGSAAVEPLAVAATHWGLFERRLAVPAIREVVTVPDLRAVGRLHRKLNRFFLRGLGSRVSARVGKGRDFDRLRDYVRGDDFRDIAWKASARRRKHIVREWRLDRSQDVLVCVDRGHRMAARVGGLSKLDHAVNAALMLSYICGRMEDRVGMLSFATEVEPGPAPARGVTQMRRLTAFASGLQDRYLHTDYAGLGTDLRRRLGHRTLIVVFTALPELEHDALMQAARLLSPRHLPLVVVLSDPDLAAAAQLLPSDRKELCRTLAAQDLLSGRAQTIRELRRLGCLVVETQPGEAGTQAMNAYLDVKARQLL